MSTVKKILNVIVALAGLNLVILVHEFGHFIFCKAFNVGTPTFSVGFDPAITYHKFRGTKFQLGAIPLGGYVAINELDLARKSYPKKMAIIFAGILFNLIFGFLALYYLYAKKQRTKVPELLDEHLGEFDHEYHEGERTTYQHNKLADFLIKATPDEARALMINLSKNRFMGPIGIISAISQSVALGFDTFLYFLATISLNIGLFNLLPLSFLDGGQATYFTLQALFGPRVANAYYGNFFYIMLGLAILFIVIISIKDIFNLRRSK